MTVFALGLVALPVLVAGYAYGLYPLLLLLVAPRSRRAASARGGDDWPAISITIPAHNEEAALAATLDRLLELDYPAERRKIIVVSDASTDGTDDIARSYAPRGVELVRLPTRGGKTAAENAARPHLVGEIVVNTDASVRIERASLKPLIAAFRDPGVGVASGRDVSVGREDAGGNLGESRYVGYEMWVRDLETRVGGIVGASGCFYASRIGLHMEIVPEALSRDFAAPLIARERGFRAESVRDAVCFVPRTVSLHREYRRKVRTMTRGLETLAYKRHLLNPLRYGRFAWMLFSHKLARWLVPLSLIPGLAGLVILAIQMPGAGWVLAAAAIGLIAGVIGWAWPEHRRPPRPFAISAYLLASLVAGVEAWLRALRGELNPVWEPTQRDASAAP